MKFLKDIFLLVVIIGTVIFLYQKYGGSFTGTIFGDDSVYTVYVENIALTVTLADSDAERVRGLSGVTSLSELGGKLFIFDDQQRHGIWMKEMQFPIDILWFNNNLELIHIEERVEPSTYPTVFAPNSDARFILEINANLVSEMNMQKGDRLTLPPSVIPSDVRGNLY